ncbi:MAG: phosphate/phosphite/phosphonate ABC transporter substrate-binding protein [Nitrospirae bacterium]|nr:phosphate/phosphite/phosphonate ABC transporter substrate-binding protein [Nitrospirota bacterium]
MKEKLEFKIVGLVISAVFVGVAIAGVVAVIFIRSDIFMMAEKYSEKYSNITASIIAKDIEDSMLAGKGAATASMIDRYKSAEEKVISILVLNSEGREAFRKEGEPIEAAAVNKIKETEAPIIQMTRDAMHFYKPLMNSEKCIKCHSAQDKIRGVVKVSMLLPLELAYERVAHRIRIVLIGLIFGVLSLGALLWFVLRRVVINPVKQIEGATKQLSEGDLSFQINVHSKDEIGRLGQDLKTAVRGIGNIIMRIKEVSQRVIGVTEGIEKESKKVLDGTQLEAESIGNISTSIEEMNASMAEIAGNITGLSTSAEQAATVAEGMVADVEQVAGNTINTFTAVDTTSASIEEMSVAIKEVAENARELSVASEETLSAVEEINSAIKEVASNIKEAAILSEKVTSDASGFGMESINKVIEGMERIKINVEKTAEFIKALGGRSEEIGKILNVIDDITDQTTLLALNAAILAAQAGEHGRGFSVVADEIKDLAERTAFSTQEIASLIQAVQSEVRGAVGAMNEGLNTVHEGTRLSGEAREALKKIIGSSKKSSEMASSIERSTSEQARGVKLVTDAMEKVRNMVEQTARATSEQTKGAALIVKEIGKIKELATYAKEAATWESKSTGYIREAIDDIFRRIQEISRAVNEQKAGSDQIVSALEGIKDLPLNNKNRAFTINKTLKDLLKDTELLMTEGSRFKITVEKAGVVRVGVMPLEAPAEMYKRFTPFVDYLSRKINKQFELKIAIDFTDTVKDIGIGVTNICYMTPSTYIEAHDKYGVEVIAKALRNGRPYHHTVIIAKERGKINKIEDIKGRTFAFGDSRSTSSHIVPRAMLLEHGIDVKDLRYSNYLGRHDDVAMAVLDGEFDAGGIMESTALRFKDQGLKFIKVSQEIPEFNICVNKEMPAEEKQLIKSAILELNDKTPEGASVLKLISPDYTGFTESLDEDYDGIREIMRKLGMG